MIEACVRFIRRNGVKNIVMHILEVYVGFLLRYLPGIEGLFLRGLFYRMMFKACAKGLLIYPNVHITFSHNITSGQDVSMNVGVYIDAQGGIALGNGIMIGPQCSLITSGHGHKQTDVFMCKQPLEYGPIVIEDDVWIGAGATILPGVRIGRGSIVAAGAVVVSDIPPFSVCGGIPAKVLRSRKVS